MPALEISADLSSFADLLNQTLRRLKHYGTESEWVAAVLDGIARSVDAAAIFAVENGQLRLCGAYQLNLPEGLTVPLSLGRAFETATETKDTVVALRTSTEVTSHLSSPDLTARGVVIPVLNETRVAAVLFAVTRPLELSPVLELVAGMASLALERRVNASANVQITAAPFVVTNQSTMPAPSRKLPFWSTLGEEQRRLHLRAQRFARAKVAEMQLFRPDACRAGREQNNIYLFLKKEIDAARDSYRDQFMERPGMEDYLHLELVSTAAGGEENKLGEDYPGHLG